MTWTIRKERLTNGHWMPTGQYWHAGEPIATTTTPGMTRLARWNEENRTWEQEESC